MSVIMVQKTVVRTTVGLEEEQHRRVQAIAEESDVSVAWVIRHAVTRLLLECEREKIVPLNIPQGKASSDAI
jgi:predicted transcriptional regulator